MNEATRRQILSDMGIPVWRLRVATLDEAVPVAEEGAAADEPPPAAEAETARAPMPAAALRSALQEAAESPRIRARGNSPGGRNAPDGRAEPAASARPAAADTAPVERFSVLALAVPGAVLVLEGSPSKTDLRLAMDVLAAASGDWQARPSSRRFDWPPAVAADTLPADVAAGARALKAFVDKDVADHRARTLLATEFVARRLHESWAGCTLVTLPELAALGGNPDAKRALWQRLMELPA